MKGTIIAIGDELLLGQVLDTNTGWIAAQCATLGIDIISAVTVPDVESKIIEVVRYQLQESDLVITTGGLGPTSDDLSLAAIAKALELPLEYDDPSYQRIVAYFATRQRIVGEEQKKQCWLPAGSIPLDNDLGTAPGIFLNYEGKILASFPGVPQEMKHLFKDRFYPLIAVKLNHSFVIHQTILTAGVGETDVAKELADILTDLPAQVSMAYLPSIGMVRLRLTAKGQDKKELEEMVDKPFKQMVERLGDKVYGFGTETLSGIIGKLLKERNMQLSLAESCTGGRIAAEIVSSSGSSAYFKGGIVAYSNEAKMKVLQVDENTIAKHGAVSHEVVIQMATGVLNLLNADISCSISGIAGPDGGSPEKPVGTCFIGIARKGKEPRSIHYVFNRDRDINMIYAVNRVMNELRLELLQD